MITITDNVADMVEMNKDYKKMVISRSLNDFHDLLYIKVRTLYSDNQSRLKYLNSKHMEIDYKNLFISGLFDLYISSKIWGTGILSPSIILMHGYRKLYSVYERYRVRNFVYAFTYGIHRSELEIDRDIRKISKVLTMRYMNQILKLQPKSFEILVKVMCDRIYSYLSLDYESKLPLIDRCIMSMDYGYKRHHDVYLDSEFNWTAHGILTRPGLIIDEQKYVIKSRSNPELYGFCFGTSQEYLLKKNRLINYL